MSEFVSIFRTNISTEVEKNKIIRMLNSLGRNLIASLDLEDDEKILRIAAEEDMTGEVVRLVRSKRYFCEEMESFYLGTSVRESMHVRD